MTERLTFSGIVQGIGFRPAALRFALDLKLTGQVKNTGGNVQISVSGDKRALNEFVQRLVDLFKISSYTREKIEDTEFDGFKIVHSDFDCSTPFITPDLATCDRCEKELKDPKNRRFNHPFISCVSCGPRYTIINSLPYDRENTVMDEFPLCRSCREEYTDPKDRRCHAQTVACRCCGPQTNIPVEDALRILKNGDVLAVKDIGGYHLACRADSVRAVKEIRRLKGRESKPFAVMFRNLEQIKEYCLVSDTQKRMLQSTQRPIVLLKAKKSFDESVSCGSDLTGAFLPCNPLQIMLLDKVSPLVMTSANIGGEPIITDDKKIEKFGVGVISHNRKILSPIDDSVLSEIAGKPHFIRRARGYVPLAIDIGIASKCDTFLAGGDLKSVFGFHRGRYVFLSQYFGDLENLDVYDNYCRETERFAKLHGFKAEKYVCDKHPLYYSSRRLENPFTVQHHKAHIASVIAEHRLKGEVLGFAFDGTGYGDDGSIWGGEVIKFDGKAFSRAEHLDYVKMIASDEISKNAELALQCYTGGNKLLDRAIENNINTIPSSSMGRLFDAVSALLEICKFNSYEGECAVMLEQAASKAQEAYPLNPVFSPKEILDEISCAKQKGANIQSLALGFHLMLAKLITKTALKYEINQIALSGGVFNNKILTESAVSMLSEKGFSVYINEKVPCGDGGIALGQAYIAALEV